MPNGTLLGEGDLMRHCPNMARKLKIEHVRERLDLDIRESKSIPSSPLFSPSTNGPPLVDLTQQNLLIRGVTRAGFLPHLKLALVGKIWTNPTYAYKVVGDARLRDVYVGNEAYRSRAATAREQTENNNAIADLVGKDYDLVVILLGTLGHKNVAAPGILREALMHREMLGKPTWLFQSSDPRYEWRHSKDAESELFIEHFQVIRLTSDDQTPDDERELENSHITVDDGKTEPADLNELVEEYEEPVVNVPSRSKKPSVKPPIKEPVTPQSDEIVAGFGGGPGGNRKKKYNNKGGW